MEGPTGGVAATTAVATLSLWGAILLALASGVRGASTVNGGALFAFGESYADTGNRDPVNMTSFFDSPWRPPYGKTWPGFPFGRFSDGRLLTDFYASQLRKPLPLPYRLANQTAANRLAAAKNGTNFAFGASGIFFTFGPQYPTVDAQISQLKGLIDDGLYTREFLQASTVLLSFVGSDYVAYQIAHPNREGVFEFIPKVVNGIALALKRLIGLGFRKFAVTKVPPFGCYPSITSANNYTMCDETVSLVSTTHNRLLEVAIAQLRITTLADFILLDLETAVRLALLQGVLKPKFPLRPCCIGLGNARCGDVSPNGTPLYTLCPNPNDHFFWDTAHPTDSGWRFIFKILFPV